MTMTAIHKRKTCRACCSKKLVPILSLGKQPLANAFLTKAQLKQREATYPLAIEFCPKCSMVQLSHVVDPAILFANYHYLTSASAPLIEHFRAFAGEIVTSRIRSKDNLVVEIGSNDGTLLNAIKDSCRVLGVDPAKNMAKRAKKIGVPTVTAFFSEKVARQIVKKEGHAQVIVANNVIAHIDDLDDVFIGVRELLTQDGVFMFEAHWLGNLIQKGGFDQIYHEHLSYFSLHAVRALAARFHMVVTDVEIVPIHGESIRISIQKEGKPSTRVQALLKKEVARGILKLSTYRIFEKKVTRVRTELRSLIEKLLKQKKSIVGYGAPAKGNTLLNYVGLHAKHLAYISDTTPLKWNLYTPGSRILIDAPERLIRERPDYALLLSWNYAPQILLKEKTLRAQGTKFIIPVPLVRIV